MIGADAASIAGIARVTALKMRTSGVATKRLMLVECWKLLLVVELVGGGEICTRGVEDECGSWWAAKELRLQLISSVSFCYV